MLGRADGARDRLLQHLIGQHGVGQVGICLPGYAGLPQPFYQPPVLIPQPLLICLLDPEHRLLQGVQVGLASVEGAASEVDAHGVDADIVDVVGLIKDHDGLAGQLLGH